MTTSYAFTPVPPPRHESAGLPGVARALTGAWRGRMFRAGEDAGTPFTLIRRPTADATVAGRFLFFATKDVAPTGVKLLEASHSSFVALVGPYYDPAEDAEVVTVLEGRRVGEELQGTFVTRLARGWRKTQPTRAAGWFAASRV